MSDIATSSPHLPIEVIERIIDTVYELEYNGTALRDLYTIWKACALTCYVMAPRSQFWLFRNIVLVTAKQASNFTSILRRNTAIASYVQVLTLSGPEKDEDGKQYTWISWIPLVFGPKMKNLRELQLGYDIFRDCHPGLPRALTAFKAIRKLAIYSTSFSSFGHCTRLIRAFPHLRHLDLFDCKWKPNPPSSPLVLSRDQRSPRRRSVQLDHLDLGGEDLSVRLLSKWLVDIEAIKSLVTFLGYVHHHKIIQDIVFPAASSILSMVLHSTADSTIRIRNGSLSSLQSMHLQMIDHTFPVLLLTSIVAAASRQLRELAVYLRIEDDQMEAGKIPEDPEQTEDDLAAYVELDAALCKPSFSGLRLTVSLCGVSWSMEAVDCWQRKLVGKLPKFYSEGEKVVVKRIPTRSPLERWYVERDGFS